MFGIEQTFIQGDCRRGDDVYRSSVVTKPQLRPDQLAYIRCTVADHLKLWERINHGMAATGVGYVNRLRRDVMHLVMALHAVQGSRCSSWPWLKPNGEHLSEDQADWLKNVVIAARRDILTAKNFFDTHGCPEANLQRELIAAAKALDIHMTIHYAACRNSGGHTAAAALDPAIWMGEGI